jgi:hypothetical protein
MIISNQPQQNGLGGLSISSEDELITIDSNKLSNIVEDTSPQLGGNLDVVTHSLISTSNRNITITPNGTGKVVLDGLSYPTTDGNAGQAIVTDGAGNLTFSDVDGAFTGLITASDTAFHSIARENTSRNTSILEFKKDIGAETSFDDLAVPMLFSLKNNSSTKYLAQIKADNDASAGKRITFASVADDGSSITEMVTFHDTDGMNIGSKKITNLTTPTNPSDGANKSYVDAQVAGLVDSAPGTLDTLNELADALGDDANFATTTATSLGEKLVKTANLSDLTNASTARTNLGLGTAATTAASAYATAAQGTKADTAHAWGNHASAGYLTSFTETNDLTAAVTWANVPDANITQGSVTQHQAALSITESQISDLGSYITASSTDSLTNKTFTDSITSLKADDGAGAGPDLFLNRTSTSPAGSDALGKIHFKGNDGAGNLDTYASINGVIDRTNSGGERGKLAFNVISNGSEETVMTATRNGLIMEAGNGFAFEGTTSDDVLTTITATDPTASRTITLPDADGTVMLGLVDDTSPQLGADLQCNGFGIEDATNVRIDNPHASDRDLNLIMDNTSHYTLNIQGENGDHTANRRTELKFAQNDGSSVKYQGYFGFRHINTGNDEFYIAHLSDDGTSTTRTLFHNVQNDMTKIQNGHGDVVLELQQDKALVKKRLDVNAVESEPNALFVQTDMTGQTDDLHNSITAFLDYGTTDLAGGDNKQNSITFGISHDSGGDAHDDTVGRFNAEYDPDNDDTNKMKLIAVHNGSGSNGQIDVSPQRGQVNVPWRLASYTTTERNALAGIVNGVQIYNETTHKFQGYANGAWVDLH